MGCWIGRSQNRVPGRIDELGIGVSSASHVLKHRQRMARKPLETGNLERHESEMYPTKALTPLPEFLRGRYMQCHLYDSFKPCHLSRSDVHQLVSDCTREEL
jgi:hypothetical protein